VVISMTRTTDVRYHRRKKPSGGTGPVRRHKRKLKDKKKGPNSWKHKKVACGGCDHLYKCRGEKPCAACQETGRHHSQGGHLELRVWRGVLDEVQGLPQGWYYELIDCDNSQVGHEEVGYDDLQKAIRAPPEDKVVRIVVKDGMVGDVINAPPGMSVTVNDNDDFIPDWEESRKRGSYW